jgi:hypothetical protein
MFNFNSMLFFSYVRENENAEANSLYLHAKIDAAEKSQEQLDSSFSPKENVAIMLVSLSTLALITIIIHRVYKTTEKIKKPEYLYRTVMAAEIPLIADYSTGSFYVAGETPQQMLPHYFDKFVSKDPNDRNSGTIIIADPNKSRHNAKEFAILSFGPASRSDTSIPKYIRLGLVLKRVSKDVPWTHSYKCVNLPKFFYQFVEEISPNGLDGSVVALRRHQNP